ncbi:MAG TPA: hypothetical protein VNK52_15780 [Hyphomicrobiaceae bacterium]|nr:hypothetical protein [Hyphomicrobiaceae bacterium]
MNDRIQDAEGGVPSHYPDPAKLPELHIYSHSGLVYWWPVWATGFIAALVTYMRGGMVRLDQAHQQYIATDSALGLSFTAVLLAVIVFTNFRLRGLISLAVVLALAFFAVLFAWLGWWDDILEFLPHLSVHMNMGFYLVFSTALLVIWLLAFFVFDRLVYWRVRPGQLTELHVIGGGELAYDTRGMLFEQHGDDFFRHIVLGLGAGDLRLVTTGAKAETIDIPNVMFANAKVRQIQRLVAVKPDEALAETAA